jgi:uncharacterized protein YheU (UPF0270 family)
MNRTMTLELDYDSVYLLLRVLREGLDNGCGDLEVDDEDKVMDIRDQLFNWLGENNEG